MGPCNHGEPQWSSMVGLDVSLKMTGDLHRLIHRQDRARGMVASAQRRSPRLSGCTPRMSARIGLETGATSTWMWTELN